MTKYKGYYIDGVTFRNKAEIDKFIKDETINAYKMYCKMFAEKPSMELMHLINPCMDKLHDEYGLSYEEIELLEIEAMKM